MRMIFYFSLIVVVIISWSCSKENNPVMPDSVTIQGTWEEEYIWSSRLMYVIGGGKIEDSIMVKKTTIKLFNNNFEIEILPPTRIVSIENDSVIVTSSSDTKYTGNYLVSGDTLKFYLIEGRSPEIFKYNLMRDSLRIQQFSLTDSGVGIYPMHSFLWGKTIFKNSGIFTRTN